MKLILNIFNWLKASVYWLMMNREVSISYIKKGIDAAQFISKMTKTNKDDAGLYYLEKFIDQAIMWTSDDEEKQKIVNALNDTKEGSLGTLNFKLRNGKVGADLGFRF